MITSFAPGSRIMARDEEWLVRRVDLTPSGAHLLTVPGLSPLVRDKEAKFIDHVEDLDEPVQLVDPKTTVPVHDPSPYYRDTRLFLEALLRQTVPPDSRLTIGHRGATDLLPYLTAYRVGRAHRLNRQECKQLWPVFEVYRALLTERGLNEPPDAFRAATRLIAERCIAFPFRAALVDEAQDFGNEALRLVRAAVPAGENDLFIVGDAHQRIYGHQVALSRCGIDIRGRGRKLRINYRNTEELKNWAGGLLKGASFNDLDAGTDDAQGVRSLLHGEPPVVKTCANETAVAEAISAQVKHLLEKEQVKPDAICVVAPTHRELDLYQQYLKQVCPTVHQIEPGRADDSGTPGLRMATIHRVKGLEFDYVVLAGRLDDLDAKVEASESTAQKRALLYVAATRARCALFVCRLADGR